MKLELLVIFLTTLAPFLGYVIAYTLLGGTW